MKGTYYMIEAAISIIMVASIFLLLFLTPQTNPEIEKANVKHDLYKGLSILAAKGSLRTDALAHNTTSISSDMQRYVQNNIQLTVVIYNSTFNNVTSNFTQPTTDAVAVSYYLAGDIGNFTKTEVRVYAWGFE